MADAADSKSAKGDLVRVRVPLSAYLKRLQSLIFYGFEVFFSVTNKISTYKGKCLYENYNAAVFSGAFRLEKASINLSAKIGSN